jgi:hypothetical protein
MRVHFAVAAEYLMHLVQLLAGVPDDELVHATISGDTTSYVHSSKDELHYTWRSRANVLDVCQLLDNPALLHCHYLFRDQDIYEAAHEWLLAKGVLFSESPEEETECPCESTVVVLPVVLVGKGVN